MIVYLDLLAAETFGQSKAASLCGAEPLAAGCSFIVTAKCKIRVVLIISLNRRQPNTFF